MCLNFIAIAPFSALSQPPPPSLAETASGLGVADQNPTLHATKCAQHSFGFPPRTRTAVAHPLRPPTFQRYFHV